MCSNSELSHFLQHQLLPQHQLLLLLLLRPLRLMTVIAAVVAVAATEAAIWEVSLQRSATRAVVWAG